MLHLALFPPRETEVAPGRGGVSSISGPLARPVAAVKGIKLFFFFLEKEWAWADDDGSWGEFLSSAQPYLASPSQPLFTFAPFVDHCSSRGGAHL